MDSVLGLAIKFFLVTNPIGNSPTILALVKDFDFNRQKKIILREGFFALLVALFFQYVGEHFLSFLQIQKFAITMTGGTLLFLVALHMIFCLSEAPEAAALKQEPFIVPIATPLLSGPGLLSIIMIQTQEIGDNFVITAGILLAWVGVMTVMAIAPYLQKLLGKKGLLALEQLMGLILAMIAIQMFVNGMKFYLEYVKV